MPVPFLPPGTPTDVCYGINQYNAARPAPSQNLINGQIIIFVLAMTIDAGVLPFVYVLRKEPAFKKVRPFIYSFVWVVCSAMWLIAAQIPSITPTFPCGLQVFLFCFSLSGFAILVFIRALILAVETLYSKRATAENGTVNTDDSSASGSGAPSSVSSLSDRVMSFGHLIKMLTLVGIGHIAPESLVLQQLIAIKSSYLSISILMTFPAIACFVILLAAFPALAVCDCRDAIFLELPIGFIIALSCDVGIAARMIFVAWKVAHKADQYGVIGELFFVIMVPAPLAMITWALAAIDPGGYGYARTGSWFYGTAFSTPPYWACTFGYALWLTYRAHRYARVDIALVIPPLQETLLKDDVIRAEFQHFAERHLVIESVRFLEDVGLFKTYFMEKDSRWRRLKAKQILVMYICVGSLLEINVPNAARSKCIALVEKMTNVKEGQAQHGGEALELFDCFNECEHEVAMMLTGGAWREFMLRRRRTSKDGMTMLTGAVVPATA